MTDIPIVSIDGTNSVEIIIPTYNVIGVTPPTLVIVDEKPIVRIYCPAYNSGASTPDGKMLKPSPPWPESVKSENGDRNANSRGGI